MIVNFIIQKYDTNREKPQKSTEFFEHYTKGSKSNLEAFEFAGSPHHKKSSRKSKKRGLFLALTKSGEFILVEHKVTAVQKPSKRVRPRKVSYKWNEGQRWQKLIGDSSTSLKRETRAKDPEAIKRAKESRRKKKPEKLPSRAKPEAPSSDDATDEDGVDGAEKYTLYFMSSNKPLPEEYLKKAFDLKAKTERKRKPRSTLIETIV